MNSRATNDALRMLADARVRTAAFMFWAMVALSAATIWRASLVDHTLPWFAAGIITGATFGALGNLVSIVAHWREMQDTQEQAREAAATIAGYVADELDKRGDGYEAMVGPEGVVVIHRRGEPEPRSRMH